MSNLLLQVGWTATGIESEATFEVDLTQGVSIY